MDGFVSWLKQLQFDGVWQTAVLIAASLLCITFHETCHGLVAYWLGDPTARRQGRLTLNPIRHIDLFGLLMMIVFRFGWAKPVPVDMRKFKNPKRGMALTALAGPVCNIILCCFFLFVYGLIFYPLYPLSVGGSAAADFVLTLVMRTAYISLALGVFNLIPIPPLDGAKVVFSFLSDGAYEKLMRYERFGMLILFALIGSRVLGAPLTSATQWLFDRLFAIAELGFDLVKGMAT